LGTYFAAMLFIKSLYYFAIHQNDNNKDIKLGELKNDDFRRAWKYRYSNENSTGKKSIDTVMTNLEQK
jgi:hypothetical protein